MSDDMLKTVKEINKKFETKSCLYVIYAQDVAIATSYKADMDKFLQSDETNVSLYDANLEEIILIHGLVLDPLVLPFEISSSLMKDRKLWLITETADITLMEPYADIVDLIDGIEYYLDQDPTMDIDDFAVLLAEELDLGLSVSKTGTSIQAAKVYG